MKVSISTFLQFILVIFVVVASSSKLSQKEGKPNGSTCTSGLQCDSYCCKKQGFLSTNVCSRLSKEGEPCESHYLNDRYTYCPCETGLKCKNSVCIDPNE